jgi:hypothetical protein
VTQPSEAIMNDSTPDRESVVQHTPGPWEVVRWRATRGGSRLGVFAANTKVADLTAGNEADAYLIAAAPELLTALNRLTYVHGMLPADAPETRGALLEAYDAAIDAIAKAEGRKS